MISGSGKKKRNQGEVELNLAAMLDMAFQLLCFFILTFKPAPVEGDVVLRMPPPMPTTVVKTAEKIGSDEKNPNPAKGLNSLIISVISDDAGNLKTLAVGDTVVNGLTDLDNRLKAVLGDQGMGFDQVVIQVSATLYYEELMQVIGVCTGQKLANGEKLSKLSLTQLPGS
jgi:biopolymer transport protein ExbD